MLQSLSEALWLCWSSKGCIDCMTEQPPKRDKYGHFIKKDGYPTGESWLTRIITEKKKGNVEGHDAHLLVSL